MKNLFRYLVAFMILIPGCNQDATEELFNPTDKILGLKSIYAPLLSYNIDPAAIPTVRSRLGNAVERPIKFKAEGILYPVAESSECPDQFKMVIEGSGIGSHIGTFTNHLNYCFIMVGPTEMELTSSITGKVIAANGDEFYVLFTGAGEDPELGYYQSYMITGGSGRFIGATGSYTLYGYVDYANGKWMHEGGGTITY